MCIYRLSYLCEFKFPNKKMRLFQFKNLHSYRFRAHQYESTWKLIKFSIRLSFEIPIRMKSSNTFDPMLVILSHKFRLPFISINANYLRIRQFCDWNMNTWTLNSVIVITQIICSIKYRTTTVFFSAKSPWNSVPAYAVTQT